MIERALDVSRHNPLAKALCAVALLALFGLLCACADTSKYVMKVDASAKSLSYGKRYVILPGLMDVKVDNPGFQAVASHLDGMLAAKGYVRAESLEQADLALYLAYGVKERRGEGFRKETGLFLEDGLTDIDQPGPSLSGAAAQQAAPLAFTRNTPIIARNGFQNGMQTGVQAGAQAGTEVAQLRISGPRPKEMLDSRVFIRTLELEALDLARYKVNDPASVVWRISVTSPGATVSLDKAMPYFLAVLSEYIEKQAFLDVQVDSSFNVIATKPNPHKHRHMP